MHLVSGAFSRGQSPFQNLRVQPFVKRCPGVSCDRLDVMSKNRLPKSRAFYRRRTRNHPFVQAVPGTGRASKDGDADKGAGSYSISPPLTMIFTFSTETVPTTCVTGHGGGGVLVITCGVSTVGIPPISHPCCVKQVQSDIFVRPVLGEATRDNDETSACSNSRRRNSDRSSSQTSKSGPRRLGRLYALKGGNTH